MVMVMHFGRTSQRLFLWNKTIDSAVVFTPSGLDMKLVFSSFMWIYDDLCRKAVMYDLMLVRIKD